MAFALCLASAAAQAQNYALTLLGSRGPGVSYASAINNAGVVVGMAATSESDAVGVVWRGGQQTTLATLGGSYSEPRALNDAGTIVGYSGIAGDAASHAALWQGDALYDLGPPGVGSGANAINNAGVVVGYLEGVNGHSPGYGATLWAGWPPTALRGFGGTHSMASGINDAGDIVGNATRKIDEAQHATLWRGERVIDLGALDGGFSLANDINNSAQAVGYSSSSSGTHAVRWDGRSIVDLGLAGGIASFGLAINNHGQAVGWTMLADDSMHAVLWNGSDAVDLNSFVDAASRGAGWQLFDARDINDFGAVVGTAVNVLTGETAAYVLAVPVPEAGRAVAMLLGLSLVGAAAGRARTAVRPRAPG